MGSAMFVPVVFCMWVVTVLALTLTGAYGVPLTLCMHLYRLCQQIRRCKNVSI